MAGVAPAGAAAMTAATKAGSTTKQCTPLVVDEPERAICSLRNHEPCVRSDAYGSDARRSRRPRSSLFDAVSHVWLD